MTRTTTVLTCLLLASLAAGCGSSKHRAATTTTASGTTQSPGKLQAEAQSAATGDIPDNQAFVVFTGAGATAASASARWSPARCSCRRSWSSSSS